MRFFVCAFWAGGGRVCVLVALLPYLFDGGGKFGGFFLTVRGVDFLGFAGEDGVSDFFKDGILPDGDALVGVR